MIAIKDMSVVLCFGGILNLCHAIIGFVKSSIHAAPDGSGQMG